MKSLSAFYVYVNVSAAVTLIFDIALPLTAVSTLQASAAQVGFLVAVCLCAPLVAGLSAGVFVQKYGIKRIVSTTAVIRMTALCLAACQSFYFGLNIYVLCVVGFTLSCAKLLDDTVMVVALPKLVCSQQLIKANGRLETLLSGVHVLAPLGCALLLPVLALPFLFCIFSAIFVVVAVIFLNGVKDLSTNIDMPNKPHLKSIVQGFAWLWKYPLQRAIAVSAGMFNFFHAMFFAVFITYALRILSLTEASYSALLSAAGLFGVMGGIFANYISRHIQAKTLLWVTLLAVGPAGIPLFLIHHSTHDAQHLVAILCLGTWEFLLVLHVVIETTVRQLSVSTRHLPAITATTRFVSWGVDPLGAGLGALLVHSGVGLTPTLGIALAGMSLSAVPLRLQKPRARPPDIDSRPTQNAKS